MSNHASKDQEKIDAYLEIIQERILAPIETTEIRNYCTVTLLLLFAAIDGLGKLQNTDAKARSNKRIRGFLGYMGGDYDVHKRELLRLRHSLVHNAINVESFLSQTEIGSDQHLKKVGAAGFINVNTNVMYEDFVNAFNQFRAETRSDLEVMKRAADRLEWREDIALDDLNIGDAVAPSPPPPVEFIYAR
jgi:hypothetical protein